ncbi:Pirin-related protein [Desulfitobacterium dichloroeliminans LMG P-21439]|uniref:Pirin-related protein n=1 Tax=Desulfitobacterium dichloroeliminans (strain LMG P-21439 / DCA1) TaxID=871963 RepID=L0F765_DESDL|nr:pirin family protein [Desulfitobacterium dichloroeliminans]AGA69007.1 Pirin-related protein [Desulfitobacterium dichloroeliminans LMG P-21439]
MSELRTVQKITKGVQAVDGAGVKLVRVIGNRDTKDYDPFLMLDAFDSSNSDDYIKGFPWHPHRGIETITYLIQGEMEHSDSLGNKGVIRDGDCQWMTAGSGIIHQEMPKPAERMLGAQLWLNLPAKDKMTPPQYGDIKSKDIPVLEKNGNKVHVIAGDYQGTPGAFAGKHVQATYLDVEVLPNSEWYLDSEEDWTLFIYIVQGAGKFEPDSETNILEKQAVLFSEGRRFWVKAGDSGIRFLLLTAKHLREPIAWGGPIVMNTKEELNLAFKELEEKTFIK